MPSSSSSSTTFFQHTPSTKHPLLLRYKPILPTPASSSDTVSFSHTQQKESSSSKKPSYPYEVSMQLQEDQDFKQMPPDKQEAARKLVKGFYDSAKTALIGVFKSYNIENPAIEYDDKNFIIRTGYGRTELRAMGIQKVGGFFEFEPTSAQKKQQAKLLQLANRYFAHFQKVRNKENPIIGNLKSKSEREILSELLKHSEGLVVGEDHASIASKKVLIDNMTALRKQGVDTLFMEHLSLDSHQADLKAYLKSPPGSEMPQRLRMYLNTQDTEQMLLHVAGMEMTGTEYNELKKKYNFTQLIKAAKEAGMNIVPIDSEASYSLYQGKELSGDPQGRLKALNYLAMSKINAEEGRGKWIAFVGSGHATTCDGIPGLAQLTGVPSLIVEDKLEGKATGVQTHVRNHLEKLNPDAVLTVDAKIPA